MSKPASTPGRSVPHAAAWATIAVEVVERAYPYVSGHVAMGPEDTDITPTRLHPAFHGALDWHSSVHMQFSLLRLLRLAGPELAAGGVDARVRDLVADRLSGQNLATEVAYLRQRPSFERPYGWAWAAMLAAEVAIGEPSGAEDESRRDGLATGLARRLDPLVEVIADHVIGWLPRQAYPVRHGKHQNDAFALTLLLYAFKVLGQDQAREAVRARALDWFADDAPADTSIEPGGSDFLSPALSQAVLMSAVLGEDFGDWLVRYLPDLGAGRHEHLLVPPTILDPDDGQFVHLAGLALSRAWQLRELAPHTVHGPALEHAADAQTAAVLPLITDGDFMATHWLVTFALLAHGGLGGGGPIRTS